MICSIVIDKFDFSLREIAKYVRLTKIAAYKPTHESVNTFYFPEDKGLKFCLFYIVPVMLGLKIQNISRYEDFISGKDFSPIADIIDSLDPDWFRHLLSRDESFEQCDDGTTVVSVEEKLKEVYNAVFNTEYNDRKYKTDIGEYSFNKNLKGELIRISGLMSKYNDMGKEQEDEDNG